MNCPKCRNGVMEQIGIIKLEKEKEMAISLTNDYDKEGIKILVCSLDECGYSEMRASPGFLSSAKKIVRNRKYGPILIC